MGTSRIEVATHTIAILDRRLGRIDSAIEKAAKRGKTNIALSAIEGQLKARGRADFGQSAFEKED